MLGEPAGSIQNQELVAPRGELFSAVTELVGISTIVCGSKAKIEPDAMDMEIIA